MAYLNFAELPGGQAATLPQEAAPTLAPAEAGFSPLEWSVIALARQDGLSTLREPSRIAKAMGSLFGTWNNPRLADDRLETLRRLAVHAWHNSYVVPLSAIRDFKAAGYTIEQYETLQASISRGRGLKRQGRHFA